MKTPGFGPLLLTLVTALSGCGKSSDPVAVARIDTLHPGLVQVTSDQPTGWSDSAGAWTYRVTLKIQPDESSAGELLEPGNLAADDWGRVYVADRKPAVIKVFDSTGRFVRTIGREGAGPGEFKVAYLAVRGSHLVVQDPTQSRTSVFDTSGTFLRSWTSACCYWMEISLDTSEIVYIPSPSVPDSNRRDRGSAYIRYRLDGTLIDTAYLTQRPGAEKVWRFETGKGTSRRSSMMTSVPFTASQVRSLHPFGGFVVGWTGDFRIQRSPTGEDTTVIATRPWTPERIPDDRRMKAVEDMVGNAKGTFGEADAREIARLADVPTSAPAFTALRVDLDGNVWARHLVGSDSARTLYDVFAPTGAWLGPVTVPIAVPDYGGQFFGHRVIYSVGEDSDGRPMVVRVNRVH